MAKRKRERAEQGLGRRCDHSAHPPGEDPPAVSARCAPPRAHPALPGHTDTDLVVHVPDADTWVVGDVIEASGSPMFGSGCYPLEFPGSLWGCSPRSVRPTPSSQATVLSLTSASPLRS